MTTQIDRHAFPGRWEQRPGGIRVPVLDEQPPAAPSPQARPIHARRECVAGHRPTHRTTTCDACGCLIAVGESCPGCLVWAERDAVRGSWRHAERLNRRRR